MPADAAKPVQAFRALQIANEQRSAYGLRYNDYGRYRKHCANRTHRLRSTLKMTHGKGREFKKLPALNPETMTNGHLQLLLFESERAWAYAQDLNAQALKPANEEHASTLRHSATGRFRRAVNWSTQLLSHCQTLHSSGRLPASQLIEATVYTLILNGRFLRYRDEFDDALVQLSVARSLVDELASTASTSRDQALAILFGDEIAPEIRYCAHEMGRERAYDINAIVKEFSGSHREDLVPGCSDLLKQLKGESGKDKGETKKLEELTWEGKAVPVRNPELVDVLLKVQEAEKRLEKGGDSKVGSKKAVAAYDATLLALSDAEEVARKLAEAQQLNGGTSTASATGERDVQFVHAFIVYQLLSRRIQRDLLLISALLSSSSASPAPAPNTTSAGNKSGKGKVVKSTQDQVDSRLYPALVKLLDTVLQSLEQMRTLSIVDDSPDLAGAVEARVGYTRAKRCLYLARCYAPVKKFAEGLALVDHANIHIRETTNNLSMLSIDPISTSSKNPFYPLTQEDVKSLESSLSSDALQFKRDWFAYDGGAVGGGEGATGGAGGKGGFKKPLFFNIALNYVDLDMDRLLVRAGKQEEVLVPQAQVAVPQKAQNQAPVQVQVQEKKPSAQKARVKEVERAETPEPEQQQQQQQAARGGLSSLLGGWWGRS